MRKNLRFLFALLVLPALVSAQSFSTNTSILSSTFTSGGVTGVTDMNNDGLDDIVILDQSKDLHIAYQQHDGSFTIENFGTVSNESQWGMCIGDIDNDGHKDVMVGGSYDDVHFVNINGPGDYQQTDIHGRRSFCKDAILPISTKTDI
ncbi:MAG: FG-GAP repeat domain-containing protein [Flavobacteriales bacterium]